MQTHKSILSNLPTQPIEGQGFYSSIIVENRNPLLDAIKADFEKSANDLKEK